MALRNTINEIASRFVPMRAILVLFLLVLQAGHAGAAGDLLVAPTRLVLEGRDRTAEVSLVNKGTEAAVYRISVIEKEMTEDGRFVNLAPDQKTEGSAKAMIRFAPRKIRLVPNQPQTVRVVLRKSRNLAAGEYRSHLLFRAVPQNAGANSVESTGPARGIAINLTPIYGVTIPVIVRHGKTEAQAAINGVALEPLSDKQGPGLLVIIGRTGSRSLFGDLRVSVVEGDKRSDTVGTISGLAVYVPNRSRSVRLPIAPNLATRLAGRTVHVEYVEQTARGESVLASERLIVR
jgi:P pilus assembly chaperone PapD